VTLTGYLRFPEMPGLFSAHEDRAKRLWFVRDHLAMSEANAWGATSPFYVDLEAPVPASGVPKPGPLQVHLRDNHMQYAITWFGLALVVLIAFGFWLVGQRRA
jgi:cytochrome oxidase assembly protein ShyY1